MGKRTGFDPLINSSQINGTFALERRLSSPSTLSLYTFTQ